MGVAAGIGGRAGVVKIFVLQQKRKREGARPKWVDIYRGIRQRATE